MAQYNEPFSTDSVPLHGKGLFNGIPAVVTAGVALIEQFPEIVARSLNEALDTHVTKARERLLDDEEYSELSEYYDVVQMEEDTAIEGGVELAFGFFGMPAKLEELVTLLEYGDANHPPRAFVRRTVFKEIPSVTDSVGVKISYALGSGVVDA